jgi:hypothetical protein
MPQNGIFEIKLDLNHNVRARLGNLFRDCFGENSGRCAAGRIVLLRAVVYENHPCNYIFRYRHFFESLTESYQTSTLASTSIFYNEDNSTYAYKLHPGQTHYYSNFFMEFIRIIERILGQKLMLFVIGTKNGINIIALGNHYLQYWIWQKSGNPQLT